MDRDKQCAVEARAYLLVARRACSDAVRDMPSWQGPQLALDDIARARDALTEAALRIAEMQKLREAAGHDDLPF